MNRDDHFRTTEGDVNFSDFRRDWEKKQQHAPTQTLLERDARYFLHQSMSTPCLDVLESASGSSMTNLQGKQYLDFHGNNLHQLGYGHLKIVNALTEQLKSLSFCPRRYTNAAAINFAEKLATLLPADLNRTLMTPNGSSAIGIALKIARAVTGKFKVVSFWDSFHGASMDSISVGGEAVFRDKMGPLLPGVEHIPPPITYRGIFEGDEQKSLEYLAYVFEKSGDIGALVAETIRNTDVQIPSKKYWKEVRKLCDRYQVLLILDEIPIALGRTGRMFAFEHFDIQPDILCLGKGLGGGIIPQAAVVCRDEYNCFKDISLGHYTHEKSPLGAVAALETLKLVEDLLPQVYTHQLYMEEQLKALKNRFEVIGQIRGIGMLWGIELVKDRNTKEKASKEAEKMMYACLQKGLSFKVSASNVLQLSPALTISREDLSLAFNILDTELQCL